MDPEVIRAAGWLSSLEKMNYFGGITHVVVFRFPGQPL